MELVGRAAGESIVDATGDLAYPASDSPQPNLRMGLSTHVEAALPPFWAKLSRGKTPATFHPLICHLLDVAATAEGMWDGVLPRCVRQDIAVGLGLEVDDACAWVSFLAAIHDIGKLSPAFQQRTEANVLNDLCRAWGGVPEATALAPHGDVSTKTLREILASPTIGCSPHISKELAAVVGGHHGTFTSLRALKNLRSALVGGQPWADARHHMVSLVARLLHLPPRTPRAADLVPLTTLAGFISVADWIGSDERWFPHAGTMLTPLLAVDAAAHLETARTRARRALTALGWLSWDTLAGARDFASLFPHIAEPRPLQHVAIAETEGLTDHPVLFVIEAPTGEGKTEAALHLAQALAAKSGRKGFYLALPTQATSNQMFGRVLSFLEHGAGGEHAELQLLHGHALLSAEFELLRRHDLHDVNPTGVAVDETEASSVAASAWFTYRKRGLLAPFGVGTVDQVLLAALQTPHVFVRLYGLTRRVVVIDEVHAYDTYMTSLLERLLAWLAALRAPVILLSATLPSSRREALCRAYASGQARTLPPVEVVQYPRLTRVAVSPDEAQVVETHLATSAHNSRTLRLTWIDSDDDIGQLLEARLAEGGCAAIVCNTVSRAQAVYSELRARWRDAPEVPDLDLFHARYRFFDREEREQRVFRRFGPRGDRPRRAVLVATQVIEQSLDVDFDVMLTDIAPVDLLLQRAGRLHRHDQARPRSCAVAELHVIGPKLDAGLPVFDRGTAQVYEPYVLLRTWLTLQGRKGIAVPDDVQGLVDRVYAETNDWATPLSPELSAVFGRAQRTFEQHLQVDREEAATRWLCPPTADVHIWALTSEFRDEDSPDLHRSFQALTRLTPPSVQAVCMYGSADQMCLEPGGRGVDLAETPTLSVARALLSRAVPIQHPGVVQALLSQSAPAAWRRSALLRHCRLLLFDVQHHAHVGSYTCRLDWEQGLVITRKGSV